MPETAVKGSDSMVVVQVRVLQPVASLMGLERGLTTQLQFAAGSTVEELFQELNRVLSEKGKGVLKEWLSGDASKLVVMRNGWTVRPREMAGVILAQGDVIAFITPIEGG